MNIAIVTVYDGLNFGSFLQAFAMKAFLEGRGHHVKFVRRFTEEENLALFTTKKPEENCDPVRKIWRKFRNMTVNREKIRREDRYYREQFPYYQAAWRRLDLVSPDQLEHIDCILCGSDEIWNFNNPNIDVPFYTCTGYGKTIPKFAVAVSAGNSSREDFRQHPEVEQSIRNFRGILARDQHTREILEDMTGQNVDTVCDPTLLVDRSVFLHQEPEARIEGKYILVYTYGLTEDQKKAVSDFAGKHDYRIVSACMDIGIADQTVYTSPLDFARLISEAECCFTTTFHGTIFSLLFARRFCTIAKFPKIKDLIESVGAETHLWDGRNASVFEQILETDIDREFLDRQLNELKKDSSTIIDHCLVKI